MIHSFYTEVLCLLFARRLSQGVVLWKNLNSLLWAQLTSVLQNQTLNIWTKREVVRIKQITQHVQTGLPSVFWLRWVLVHLLGKGTAMGFILKFWNVFRSILILSLSVSDVFLASAKGKRLLFLYLVHVRVLYDYLDLWCIFCIFN